MQLATIISLLAATAAASPNLAKRCSPAYDPELALGYYPPAPCWQTFDPACRPYLRDETEMTLDAQHKLAVVYGVSTSCQAEIAEELARQADGRKNYGWLEKHGRLTVIPGNILVISSMSDAAVDRYSKLTRYTRP